MEKSNGSNTCENSKLNDFSVVSNAPNEVFNENDTDHNNVITSIGDGS